MLNNKIKYQKQYKQNYNVFNKKKVFIKDSTLYIIYTD